MSKQKRYIQVFEHESIYTHENEDGRYLMTTQFEQLCAYNVKHKNKFFTVLNKGVKFSQYVGVIQVGRVTIEILPKTDQNESTKFWHDILLQMLAECNKIKKESISEAILRKRENTLLDLYIELYLDEVEKLVYKGLVKKYLRDQNQTKALKGKLLFANHIRKNLVHKERFYTEHTIYTSDNIYNQIVKRGLHVIFKLNCSSYLKDRAMGLGVYFFSISNESSISDNTFQKLTIARNTQVYSEAIKIARLIILNYSPDIKSGTEDLLAILFDMNLLWQEYILIQLQKKATEGTSIYKGSKPFWENRPIEPDIVIQTGEDDDEDTTYQILDTKWKVLDQSKPSADDLKQMFTYNIYWNCNNSVLLYPKTPSSPETSYGKYHKGMSNEHGCILGFVDLLDDKKNLNKDVDGQVKEILKYEKKKELSNIQ